MSDDIDTTAAIAADTGGRDEAAAEEVASRTKKFKRSRDVRQLLVSVSVLVIACPCHRVSCPQLPPCEKNCTRGCHHCEGWLNELQLKELESCTRRVHCDDVRALQKLRPGDEVDVFLPETSRSLPVHLLKKGSVKGIIIREHRLNPGFYLVRLSWQQEGRGGKTYSEERPGVRESDLRLTRPNMDRDLAHGVAGRPSHLGPSAVQGAVGPRRVRVALMLHGCLVNTWDLHFQ